jgi:hypothetical protein
MLMHLKRKVMLTIRPRFGTVVTTIACTSGWGALTLQQCSEVALGASSTRTTSLVLTTLNGHVRGFIHFSKQIAEEYRD